MVILRQFRSNDNQINILMRRVIADKIERNGWIRMVLQVHFSIQWQTQSQLQKYHDHYQIMTKYL